MKKYDNIIIQEKENIKLYTYFNLKASLKNHFKYGGLI